MADLTLDHAAVISHDMDADLEFYSNLGFAVETRYGDWAMLRDARGNGLALLSPGGLHPPHFALRAHSRGEVEDIARQHQGRVSEHRDGSVSVYIKDRSNNSLEIIFYPEQPDRSY